MCADCVCSVAGDCVLVMAIVRFDVKNAIGHVSCWMKFDNCVFAPNVVKNTMALKKRTRSVGSF